jgi:septum formation protein
MVPFAAVDSTADHRHTDADADADAGQAATPRLVLASASPRRRELLASLDLEFTVRPVGVPEVRARGEAAADYVLRLAREKAAAGARPGELLIAADTVVVLPPEDEDGEVAGGGEAAEVVLEKPANAADARRMLRRIAGRRHTVLTGVALLHTARLGAEEPPREASEVVASRVWMAPLSDAEVAWYVDTGEPMDKAGSYAIQGLGALLVEAVEGNYTNVVGLPLPTVYRLAGRVGCDLRRFRRRP